LYNLTRYVLVSGTVLNFAM